MNVLLAIAINIAAFYLFSAKNGAFGFTLHAMTIIVLLLGLFKKLDKTKVRVIFILFIIFGLGSEVASVLGYHGICSIAQGITILIFSIFGISSILKQIFKILLILGGALMLLLCIGKVYLDQDLEDETPVPVVVEEPEDGTEEDFDLQTEEKPSDILRSHSRKWRDLHYNAYKGKLEVWESDYKSSNIHRNQYDIQFRGNSTRYWRSVYIELLKHDTPLIDKVLEMFIALAKKKELDQMEFAEMIVTCVQDIPYVLIYRENCNDAKNESLEMRDLVAEYGCKGNMKFGLQAPAEFIYNLEGDCDTRTVFLFAVFDKLGYKVSILNSEVYGHSVLGISLPAKGKSKTYLGTQYYFWETTAKGWEVGVLPPNMQNEAYWDVIVHN